MNELLNLIRKSKTAKSGVVTIIWGILLMFGVGGVSEPKTIDDMNTPPSNIIETLIGLGAAGSGVMTLKGRNDVEKRMKGTGDEKTE